MIKRPDALFQAAGDEIPLLAIDHARNDIERDDPFRVAALAIDGEGHADAHEQNLGFAAAQIDACGIGRRQPFAHFLVGRARRRLRPHHFIETMVYRAVAVYLHVGRFPDVDDANLRSAISALKTIVSFPRDLGGRESPQRHAPSSRLGRHRLRDHA